MNVITSSDNPRIILSFSIALFLHIAVLLLLPLLKHLPIQPPERFDIDLTQFEMQSKTELPQPADSRSEQPPIKPALSKVDAKPKQQTLSVVDARADAALNPLDTQVPNATAIATAAPVTLSVPFVDKLESSVSETSSETSTDRSQMAKIQQAEPSEIGEGYGQQLYDSVAKNKSYPAMAIRRHLEGQVNLIAKFNMGDLVDITVQDTGTGYQVLDVAAIEMLKKAINSIPVKGALLKKNFTVIVPVNFKLEE